MREKVECACEQLSIAIIIVHVPAIDYSAVALMERYRLGDEQSALTPADVKMAIALYTSSVSAPPQEIDSLCDSVNIGLYSDTYGVKLYLLN